MDCPHAMGSSLGWRCGVKPAHCLLRGQSSWGRLEAWSPPLPCTFGCHAGCGHLLVAQGGFLGLEGCGCPIGMITFNPLHTSLRLASLIQLQQHRAAAAHCRTYRCPCPVDTCSVPKGESVPSLEFITGSLDAQLLAEPKKPHSSSPAQAGWLGRGLCTHRVG